MAALALAKESPSTQSKDIAQAGVAARTIASVGLQFCVITWAHRRQAGRPSCWYQRHSGRIRQEGRDSVTAGRIWTIREARWQSFPSKCRHSFSTQGAARRKTSVGFTGAARLKISGVAGIGSSRWASRGSAAVPATTPRTRQPGISAWALGH